MQYQMLFCTSTKTLQTIFSSSELFLWSVILTKAWDIENQSESKLWVIDNIVIEKDIQPFIATQVFQVFFISDNWGIASNYS